jgi:hypothetical protein
MRVGWCTENESAAASRKGTNVGEEDRVEQRRRNKQKRELENWVDASFFFIGSEEGRSESAVPFILSTFCVSEPIIKRYPISRSFLASDFVDI